MPPFRRMCLLALIFVASCANPDAVDDAWSGGIAATAFEPAVLVPGVKLHMSGQGLVTETLGYTSVRFLGSHNGSDGTTAIDVVLAADVLSETRLSVVESTWNILCASGAGTFEGTAVLEVTSRFTERSFESAPLSLTLECRETLVPTLVSMDPGAVTLNASISLVASSLLLGGDEGSTTAEITGCFKLDSVQGVCATAGESVGPIQVDVGTIDAVSREGGQVMLPPTLVGLRPGVFEGEVRIVNRHASGEIVRSDPLPWWVTVLPSRLDQVEVDGASMGGLVNFTGAGFVGAVEGAGTDVLLVGNYAPDDGGPSIALDLILVPTFSTGERLHYVLDEQDGLGRLVDYRMASGTVSGTFTPRFFLNSDTVSGPTIPGSFRIEPVRQVVWLNLTQSYTDALAAFGLREADEQVADVIVAVIDEIYGGLNVDVRRTVPDDYLLFAQVDVTAIDPNGYGLLGYDNTPGKDDGNTRLYDHIGGLNALTQQDGYPGYGGVFLESIWAFSLAPATPIEPISGASARFDSIFDPVRPDLGTPVTASELAGYTPLASGEVCTPGVDRPQQVQCAIWVLGHVVGGTIAHELAHSFGLADPGGTGFHNSGDGDLRLMDSGDDRPFVERAALDGPAEYLCQENFDYLRGILSAPEPDPRGSRAPCR